MQVDSLHKLLQRSVRRFIFNAEQPIEMEFLSAEMLFQVFAAGRIEFDEHLAFLHVNEDAPRRNRLCRK